MTLYFAYGSNISVEQMKRRAPGASVLEPFVLKDWQLVFRGVADVVPKRGSSVPGLIWRLTPEDEEALDAFEGYDARFPLRGSYRKEYIRLAKPIDGEKLLMVYVMNSEGVFPPYGVYLQTIVQGYRKFDLPTKELRKALHYSHDAKAPSFIERNRYRRLGRPPLIARDALDRPKGKAGEKPASPAKDELAGELFETTRAMAAPGSKPLRKPVLGPVEVSCGNWHRNLIVHGD